MNLWSDWVGGYIDDQEGYQPNDKPAKRVSWKAVLFAFAYFVPLFFLWSSTDFPDSLGVHIAARGSAALVENWYYSYLLLNRHHVLDVITFIYMWSIVIGFSGWVAVKSLKNMRFSLYSDAEIPRRTDVKPVDKLSDRAAFPSLTPSEWVFVAVLIVALLAGLGLALGYHPRRMRDIMLSERTIRGRCFNEEGSYPQSEVNSACKQLLKDTTLAIRNQPDNPRAHFDRGFAYEHAGDLNHAIADFSEVIRLVPDHPEAYYFRWAAYEDLGNDEKAEADFATLARLDPQFAARIRSIR